MPTIGDLQIDGVLELQKIEVQNVNAISSPLTWGFPSMTAFISLMWALERILDPGLEIGFDAVGVVCHKFTPQISKGGFEKSFCLTRNPLNRKGETASIAEEGRARMQISLIFNVCGRVLDQDEDHQQQVADTVLNELTRMRIAGGTVVPPSQNSTKECQAKLWRFPTESEDQEVKLREMKRRLIPGSYLVLREDLLTEQHDQLKEVDQDSSLIDAWMNLTTLKSSANLQDNMEHNQDTGSTSKVSKVQWITRGETGWLVPIPVGYGAISEIQKPCTVANARDTVTQFQFVESLFSIGEWIGPHRFTSLDQILWSKDNDKENGIYRCTNNYSSKKSLTKTGEKKH